MANAPEGAKVFIDPVILEKVEAAAPSYMTRTAWVNQLLDIAVCSLEKKRYPCAANDV